MEGLREVMKHTARQTDESKLNGLFKSGGEIAELTRMEQTTANSVGNGLLSGSCGTTDGGLDSTNSAADNTGTTVEGARHTLGNRLDGAELTLGSYITS